MNLERVAFETIGASMGRQVQFFVNGDDREELLRFAESKGFRALPTVIVTDTIPTLQNPTEFTEPVPSDAGFFYLLPGGFSVVEAFYKELPRNPARSKLLASTSPVIEISPKEVSSNGPATGRIYFCNESDDPRHGRALKAFNILAGYVRKWQKTELRRTHVGPHLAQECRSGNCRLMYGGKQLEIL